VVRRSNVVEVTGSPTSVEQAARVRNVPFTRTHICAEARRAVQDVLESGWVTSGQVVVDFEQEFADHVGARHALAVSSCTSAIELALRAMRLQSGAKVLMSANTFCGAAAAIIHAGLRVVVADVDPLTGMPSPETISEAADEAGGVDAMVVVHLGGLPTPVAESAAAARLGLDRVVEDAAHALGTWVDDQQVGSISRATCFSFYATKNLAIGEGGMVTTDDDELAQTISRTRLHGMSKDAWKRYLPGGGWHYDVEVEGLKANMTDVQAAIGRAQLGQFPRTQARRAEVARRYDANIVGIEGLTLPPRPLRGTHAWHLYAVRVRPAYGTPRDALVDALRDRGIGSSVHFIPLHRLTWYASHCLVPRRGLPGADEVFAETLSLPMDQVIHDDEIDAVCIALAEIGDQK
jgi:dTDP-4-amino-4,6-dideoxygalactose transaminase